MNRYVVTVIHQVTETYEVVAESREEAWRLATEGTGDPSRVWLIRTDHGRREVWEVKRKVDDVDLPT